MVIAAYCMNTLLPPEGACAGADLLVLVNCEPFSKEVLEKSSRPLNWALEKSAVDRNVVR